MYCGENNLMTISQEILQDSVFIKTESLDTDLFLY